MSHQNNIRISHVPFFHIIVDIPDAGDMKKPLLKLISKINNPVKQGTQTITNQDYFNPTEDSKEYVDLFVDLIRPQIISLFGILNVKDIMIKNVWFQQYKKGDSHSWHTHEGCMMSNIYYLEKPLDTDTEFFNYETQQPYGPINIKEGSILMFPSCILHRAKPNPSDKRKTIISFNTNFIS
jgi:hypothetical protein